MSGPDGSGFSFIKLWGSIFGFAEHDEDAATTALVAFRSEIELTRTKMLEHGVPEDLFRDALNRIKGVTSATLLHTEWRGHKSGLPPDVMLALKWSAWTLPKEEDELAPEELSALVAELDALQEAIASSNLSAYVREFTLRQIDLIRTALRQYRIGGIAPVEEALEAAYGAVRRSCSALSKQVEGASERDRSILTKFQTVLTKTAETADKVDKVRKGGEALMGIGKVVGEAFDGLTKLLT